MKSIINWRQASICDVETDGFLEEVTKLHVVGIKLSGTDRVIYLKGDNHKRIKSMLDYHIKNKIPIVGHNFITYDVPVLEKLLGVDLSELIVIDTLQLSWYLNTNHKRHSIEALSKDYKTNLEKYQVAEGEWKNLSWEDAVLRVTGDVLLNEIIWEDFKERLVDMYSLAKESIDSGEVGGTRVSPDEVIYLDSFIGDSVEDHVERLLTFLMFKVDMQRLQELTGWFVDQPYLLESISKLEELVGEAATALEGIMPKVPKYTKRNEPKNKFLKKGGLSVAGAKWQSLISRYSEGVKDDRGTSEVLLKDGNYHELTSYAEPNINSHQQVKSFLFSHGWIPQTFKYVRDDAAFEAWIKSKPKRGAKHWEWSAWKDAKPDDRAIPQIRVDVDDGKELCESVSELAEEVPEIQYLEEYTVIKHRLDALKGILSRIDSRGYVQASCHGYANTLRLKHRAPIVNLPQAHKKYAAPIRGCLIAQEGYVLVGSDLSSLENRVGHHFMLPHDPEYVATMNAEDYDAHLYTAWAAKMISEQDMIDYKADVLLPFEKKRVALARSKGKTTNYACLPADNTDVLTDKGWVKGVDVREGDYVVAYNPKTKQNELSKVTATHFYKDAYVELVGNRDFSVESTMNHRWYGWSRITTHNRERVRVDCVKTTEEFNTEFNIINSAPYYGGDSGVTPEEASLMGWLLSDGYYKWSELGEGASSSGIKKRGVIASIHQAEHKYTDQLEDAIVSCGMSFIKSVRRSDNTNKVYEYRLKASQVRDFLDRVVGDRKQKHETDWDKWVLGLKEDSLKSFVNAFYLGDGNTKSDKDSYMSFSQNSGKVADGLVLAGYLLGYNITHREERKCGYIRFQKDRQHTTCQRFKTIRSRVADVFCLTTELGSFVIKQGGVITITGNCVYGAGAKTIAEGAGVSLEEGEALHTGYWELNWSVKTIASEQVVVVDKRGGKWLVNPINGMLYSVRSEKDYFSTLVQGTGSWIFNMWEDLIIEKQKAAWGKATQTAEMHDEIVWCIKNNPKYVEQLTTFILDAIKEVSEKYLLRREMGCDIQSGKRYSDIH